MAVARLVVPSMPEAICWRLLKKVMVDDRSSTSWEMPFKDIDGFIVDFMEFFWSSQISHCHCFPILEMKLKCVSYSFILDKLRLSLWYKLAGWQFYPQRNILFDLSLRITQPLYLYLWASLVTTLLLARHNKALFYRLGIQLKRVEAKEEEAARRQAAKPPGELIWTTFMTVHFSVN